MSDSDTQAPIAWNTIKPEAAIFTDMILQYGIEGIVAQNILDTEGYDKLSEDNTFGFVFAYRKGSLQFQDASVEDPDAANIVFTHQFIDNSCATLSLFNILFNTYRNTDNFTQAFLDHTSGMDANNRGHTFMVSPPFEKIHNSYDIIENQAKAPMNTLESNNEASYHYISYIYKNNSIWELDNQNYNPIKLYSISSKADCKESWLLALKRILCDKIETNSLESNLIAITLDPIVLKESELKRTYSEIRGLETKLMSTAKSLFTRKAPKTLRMTSLTKEGRKILRLKQKLEKNTREIRKELKQLRQVGSMEQDDIDRRKFDYSPFIWDMLEILHQKVPNLEEVLTSSITTDEGLPALSQINGNTTYLSLKEKDPTGASSSFKDGECKKKDDPNFVKRELPKRKCTENVIYSVKKVSVVPSDLSAKIEQEPRLKVIPQKHSLEDNNDEDSSNRSKRRYFLRKRS